MSGGGQRDADILRGVIDGWTWWKSFLVISIGGGFLVYAVNACCVPMGAVAIASMTVLIVAVFLVVILGRTVGWSGW